MARDSHYTAEHGSQPFTEMDELIKVLLETGVS